MSEKIKHGSHEKQPNIENVEAKEQLDKIGEKLTADAEKERQRDKSKEAEKARKSAEKLALSSKEKRPKSGEKQSESEPVTRGIKKQTYRATMKRVEAKLPAYQRSFSRFINNDTVDRVSAVASKTVARPSALLGSGLVTFLGLAVTTYYANNIGFEVNSTMFVVLIVVGWVAGLIVELVYKTIRKTVKN